MSRVRRLARLVAAVCLTALWVWAGAAQADVFRAVRFDFVRGEAQGAYELSVALPQTAANLAALQYPEQCRQVGAERQASGGQLLFAFEIQCDGPLKPTDTILVPWSLDGALFASGLTGSNDSMAVETTDQGAELPIGRTAVVARSVSQVAADYLWQGFVHILMGWDHLAFVLSLCLLTRGKTLLLLVTTFTLGHSLSLALAFFEVLKIPVPPVEAVIALSIAFMAREALMREAGSRESAAARARYVAVVGAFGLLHGLGFASVLGDLGLVQAERVPGLIFFNLGVEAGQLAFVAVVSAVMWAAARIRIAEPARIAALHAAGVVGAFWVFERVTGFLPGLS
ncbi:HupE/UreJ family protein [Phenylobacterium sp. LjRoot219]|uniref:HupE/UreJ family protein n=1 Tax=Phenylobacterium sp. LjRoot219 TaxID=3342283 RepID=UPI003ECE486F